MLGDSRKKISRFTGISTQITAGGGSGRFATNSHDLLRFLLKPAGSCILLSLLFAPPSVAQEAPLDPLPWEVRKLAYRNLPFSPEEDPALERLGAAIARFLSDGDLASFMSTHALSLEDTKALWGDGEELPEGFEEAIEKFHPQKHEQLRADLEGILELVSPLGLPKAGGSFRLEGIRAHPSPTVLARISNATPSDYSTEASLVEVRLSLDPEAIGKLGEKYRGDCVLWVDDAVRTSRGWFIEGLKFGGGGIRWEAFPSLLEAEPLRWALPGNIRDLVLSHRPILLKDDPALGRLGESVRQLLARQDVSGFLSSAYISLEDQLELLRPSDPEVHRKDVAMLNELGIEADVSTDDNIVFYHESRSDSFRSQAQAVLDMASIFDLSRNGELFQVEEIRVGPTRVGSGYMGSGAVEGSDIDVELSLPAAALTELGLDPAGKIVLRIGSATRLGDDWRIDSYKFGWMSLPRHGNPEAVELLPEEIRQRALAGTLTTMKEDPALERFGEEVLQLVSGGDVAAFLASSAVSAESLAALYGGLAALHEDFDEKSMLAEMETQAVDMKQALRSEAEEALDFVSDLDLPRDRNEYQLVDVLVGDFGMLSLSHADRCVIAPSIDVVFSLAPEAIGVSGRDQRVVLVLDTDDALRTADGWKLMGKRIDWKLLPWAVLGEKERFSLDLNWKLRELARGAWQGHRAPEFVFYSLEDGTEHSSEELAGRVVALQSGRAGAVPARVPWQGCRTWWPRIPSGREGSR